MKNNFICWWKICEEINPFFVYQTFKTLFIHVKLQILSLRSYWKLLRLGSGEMGQWVKTLTRQAWEPEFKSPGPMVSKTLVACICNPCFLMAGWEVETGEPWKLKARKPRVHNSKQEETQPQTRMNETLGVLWLPHGHRTMGLPHWNV